MARCAGRHEKHGQADESAGPTDCRGRHGGKPTKECCVLYTGSTIC
ncbi:MAG: hypothetical protein JRI97_09130 [Deltaproteobacteria bacterium]|nr:hypothetical protein [Deltaproteobacteria bacterium]